MKKGVSGLLLAVLLALTSACAPTLRNVGTSVSRTVSGESVILYEATAWDIVTALVEAAPRMQPSAAHTNYFTSNVGDSGITLSSSPLSSGTAMSTLQTSNAIDITLKVATEDIGAYVQVTFNPEPAGHRDARAAQSDLIDMLDKQFVRYEGS